MLYEFDLTIPPNTAADSPTEISAKMSAGTIHQVEVQIPRGCNGLTHVRVFAGEHPVWPSNPDGNIKGNDARIVWREFYEMAEPPFTLTLRGWNEDDSYPHTITFRFAVAPPGLDKAASEHAGLLDRIAEFLGLGG